MSENPRESGSPGIGRDVEPDEPSEAATVSHLVTPRYWRKKPVVIEAVQLTWQTWNEVCDLLGPFPEGTKGMYWKDHTWYEDFPGDPCEIAMKIWTLEGAHYAREGDWIIKGVQGEFYPCKPDIFEQTYEPA